jgi:hypothetical protein
MKMRETMNHTVMLVRKMAYGKGGCVAFLFNKDCKLP